MDNVNNQQSALSKFWMDFLMKEFANETDRGAVVLACSLVDNALTTLLQIHLLPSPDSEDALFDGGMAPLSHFNSKINFTQRLGLISSRLARDIHLVRKMRNEFAHNIDGSTLESGKIKQYLTTLISSSEIVKGHSLISDIFPEGAKGQLLQVANLILFCLNGLIEEGRTLRLNEKPEEWIYTWSYTPLVALPEMAKNKVAPSATLAPVVVQNNLIPDRLSEPKQ